MPSLLRPRLAALWTMVTLLSCTGVPAPQKQALSEAAPTILGVKSEAEMWAHRIKSTYGKGSQQYEGAYTRYIAAKAAFDAWLDRFSSDIALGTDITSSDTYQAALHDAAGKGEEFIRFAKGLYEHSLSGPSPVSWLAPLTDAALKVWDKFNTAGKEAKAEVTKTVQSWKWKSFDEA